MYARRVEAATPVEEPVNGTVRFAYPANAGGREVEDVRLVFRDGKVVDASAVKNEEYLVKMLNTDDGARRLGELGIGYGITRYTRNTLFDKKIGGTCISLWATAIPRRAARTSPTHWDPGCDLRQGGETRVDGEVFAKDGKFAV
jgi:aminopeptidase